MNGCQWYLLALQFLHLIALEAVTPPNSDYYQCPDHHFLAGVNTKCALVHAPEVSLDVRLLQIHARSTIDQTLTYNFSNEITAKLVVSINPVPPAPLSFVNEQDPTSYAGKLMGIALDGVPIYSAISDDGSDLVVNTFDGTLNVKVDYCGGMFGMTADGLRYHYRVMPTCVLDDSDAERRRSIFVSSIHELLDPFLSFRGPRILGYSLAGYPIYSPLTTRGLLQDRLDNCNGKFTNDSYGYYVTPHFPYIMGCEGPGVYTTKETGVSLEGIPTQVSGHAYTSCPGGFYPSTGSTGCLPCPAGKFSAASYNIQYQSRPACHMSAPMGYYSPAGSTKPHKCPSGRYGAMVGLGDDTCSGPCREGYYCPSASTTSTAYPCGSVTSYCPVGSFTKYTVDVGFYTGPESVDEKARYLQLPCGPGTYCHLGKRFPCPRGTYGSSDQLVTAACTAKCPIGQYCPEGSVEPIDCPAGRYGDSVGLATADCSGACQPGYWCPAKSTSPREIICAAGRYGAESGLATAECNAQCESGGAPNATSSVGTKYCLPRYCSEGHVCPAGSTSPTQVQCGGSNVYCPPRSVFPTTVDFGYYSVGPISQPYREQSESDVLVRTSQRPCEPGYFCIGGVRLPCPRGHYGGDFNLNSTTCSGLCTQGYRCDVASPSPTQFACWTDSSYYCPTGSFAPVQVPNGYYSIGSSETTRHAIVPCPPGMYCQRGVKYDCAAGLYSAHGSPSEMCDGFCDSGYYCPTRSTSPRQVPCPAGRFGTAGMTSSHCAGSCLKGYYCPTASTTPFQVECGSEYLYCPHGSSAPTPVSLYHFSTGGNSTTRFGQTRCVFSDTLGTPPAGAERVSLCPATTVWPP